MPRKRLQKCQEQITLRRSPDPCVYEKMPWISQALEDYKGKELLEDGLEAYKGKWRALLGDKPLYLEIGCGKGQFISQMAQLHPENAYLGIETQRDVCYYAVKKSAGSGN